MANAASGVSQATGRWSIARGELVLNARGRPYRATRE